MCDKVEVVEAINEELFTPKNGEDQGRLDKHVDAKLNKLFWRMMRWIGLPIMGLVAAWFNMQMQVNENSKELIVGGRYTQEEHDLYAIEQDRRFQEVSEKQDALRNDINGQLSDIKADVRDIRKAVVGY